MVVSICNSTVLTAQFRVYCGCNGLTWRILTQCVRREKIVPHSGRGGRVDYGNDEHREMSLYPVGSVHAVLSGSLMAMTSGVRYFTLSC